MNNAKTFKDIFQFFHWKSWGISKSSEGGRNFLWNIFFFKWEKACLTKQLTHSNPTLWKLKDYGVHFCLSTVILMTINKVYISSWYIIRGYSVFNVLSKQQLNELVISIQTLLIVLSIVTLWEFLSKYYTGCAFIFYFSSQMAKSDTWLW